MWLDTVDFRAAATVFVRATFVLVAALLVSWTAYAYAEARSVRIDRHTISDARIPVALDGTTLVFAADIHAGPFLGASRVRALVQTINAENPDLVILGGDYVGGRAGGAAHFYPFIGEIDARLGVFAVLGNHDVWEGADAARKGMADAGIVLLENELAYVGDENGSLALVGLEDQWTGSPDATSVASEIRSDEFTVLVSHNPDAFDIALASNTNRWGLALAGHTHGGQIRGAYELMDHRPTRFGERFLGGWSDENGTPVLVTNGVGTVTVPFRTLAPAQIHVITLRHETPEPM